MYTTHSRVLEVMVKHASGIWAVGNIATLIRLYSLDLYCSIIRILTGRRRRRSSLFQSLSNLASGALVSAMGASHHKDKSNVSHSGSEDEKDTHNNKNSIPRNASTESDISVKLCIAPEPEDVEFEITVEGNTNQAFKFDEQSIETYTQSKEQGNKEIEVKHEVSKINYDTHRLNVSNYKLSPVYLCLFLMLITTNICN